MSPTESTVMGSLVWERSGAGILKRAADAVDSAQTADYGLVRCKVGISVCRVKAESGFEEETGSGWYRGYIVYSPRRS